MKSRGDFARALIGGAACICLAACAGRGEVLDHVVNPAPASRSIATGPAADFPVVLGDAFVVDGVTYTPLDTMNYDEVGYAASDPDAAGVTAAHRTLPLPSYVEVTALESGRTALVRVERRGPMTGARLVALSSGAMAQLGLTDGAPVRVRRVNPPEDHRAELRRGNEAPLRMETPPGLLEVLRRKLPATGAATLSDPRQAAVSGREPSLGALAEIEPDVQAAAGGSVEPDRAVASGAPVAAAVPTQGSQEAAGKYVVQVGAFSVRSNADRLAARIDGFVDNAGRLALVRIGPFASREQAAEALAKLRSQGYSDARIEALR